MILTIVFFYFGMPDVAIFTFLFAILFLTAFIWSRYALARLAVSAFAANPAVFPGERIVIRNDIENKKLLPLIWLELCYRLPKNGMLEAEFPENRKELEGTESGEMVPAASARIAWLLWYEESRMEIPLIARKRGLARMDAAMALSGDGFGLGNIVEDKKLVPPLILAVYPALVPVNARVLAATISDTEAGRGGYMEDVTLLKMSRDYEPGDPAKRINWRQLAGQGKLTTNIYETIYPKMLTFIVDLASFRRQIKVENAMSGGEDLVWVAMPSERERMLSVLGSLIVSLSGAGILCGLVLPAVKDKAAETVRLPGRSDSGAESLLLCLAGIDYEAEDAAFTTQSLREQTGLFGTVCVVTRSYARLTLKDKILRNFDRCLLLADAETKEDASCRQRILYRKDISDNAGADSPAEKEGKEDGRVGASLS